MGELWPSDSLRKASEGGAICNGNSLPKTIGTHGVDKREAKQKAEPGGGGLILETAAVEREPDNGHDERGENHETDGDSADSGVLRDQVFAQFRRPRHLRYSCATAR